MELLSQQDFRLSGSSVRFSFEGGENWMTSLAKETRICTEEFLCMFGDFDERRVLSDSGANYLDIMSTRFVEISGFT